jgi:hypothetical protein
MPYGRKRCDKGECQLRELRAENERLYTALKTLFLLACTCDEIRPDSKQMRETGQLLAKKQ